MKRNFAVLLILPMLIVLAATALGGGIEPGSNPRDVPNRPYSPDIAEDVQAIVASLTEAVGQITSTFSSPKGGAFTECLIVDVQLPDTILAADSIPMAHGSFTLINCGESAVVEVGFQAIISIPGIFEDTLDFGPRPIYMMAGDSVHRPFHFRVLPYSGTYTICAIATSDSTYASDCATMVVMGTLPPWLPFRGCGFLMQAPNCVLFVPQHGHAPGGPGFVLENYGSFQPGDNVCVEGKLFFLCQPPCPEASACIIENTIVAAPPDTGTLFRACGVLAQGTNCVYFDPGVDSVNLVLDNYGPYLPGDSVCVEGMLTFSCQSPCPEAIACLLNNTISAPPSGEPYGGCGVLIHGIGCVLFVPEVSPSDEFVLDFYGPFVPGDSVCVRGLLVRDCQTPCPGATGCIIENSIFPPPPPPGEPFQACGTLAQSGGCLVFTPMGWPDTVKFLLDNYGPFDAGDSVCIFGMLVPPCDSICLDIVGCIRDNTIDSLPPGPGGEPFHACGILLPSGDCLVFVPMDRPHAPKFLLDNYGAFQAYDSVCVNGLLVPPCDSTCPDIAGCVLDNTIVPWSSGPGVPFHGCGVLVPDSGCVLFAPMCWMGGLFKLDNYGNFNVFDSVLVDGILIPGCQDGCPGAAACIVQNTIAPCGPPARVSSGLRARNHPNPFNPGTTISFDLSQSGHVKLSVYNLLGQVITVLHDDFLPAGSHSVTWNGTDAFGNSMPSGIYFYRVDAGSLRETRKMLLVK